MKALSIQQPWAGAIMAGVKKVENRTWGTDYRGLLIVHAGLSYDKRGLEWILANRPRYTVPSAAAYRGAFLGVVELLDCCPPGRGPLDPWRVNTQHGWRLGKVWGFAEPIRGAGQLGLFLPPAHVLDAAAALCQRAGPEAAAGDLLAGL